MAKGKKKIKRNVPKAIAHVKSTFNNTIITITDLNGETLCYSNYNRGVRQRPRSTARPKVYRPDDLQQ